MFQSVGFMLCTDWEQNQESDYVLLHPAHNYQDKIAKDVLQQPSAVQLRGLGNDSHSWNFNKKDIFTGQKIYRAKQNEMKVQWSYREST